MLEAGIGVGLLGGTITPLQNHTPFHTPTPHSFLPCAAVPTMHQILLARAEQDYPAAAPPPLRAIRSCSSSLAPATLHKVEAAFKAPVLEVRVWGPGCLGLGWVEGRAVQPPAGSGIQGGQVLDDSNPPGMRHVAFSF